jgi:hypothetical protein
MRFYLAGLLLAVMAAPVLPLAAADVRQSHVLSACEDRLRTGEDDATGQPLSPATEPSIREEESEEDPGDLILSERWERRSGQELYGSSEQALRLFYPPGSRRPLWGY